MTSGSMFEPPPGQVVSVSAQMREGKDLSEYDRKEIVDILANALVEDYLHPRPSCRFCLRDNCPALNNEGECPAERPLRWLPSDAPRKRSAGRSRSRNQSKCGGPVKIAIVQENVR